MNQLTMSVWPLFFLQYLQGWGLCQSCRTFATNPFSRGQPMQDWSMFAIDRGSFRAQFIITQPSTICRKVESFMQAHEQKGIKHVLKPSDVSRWRQCGFITVKWLHETSFVVYISGKNFLRLLQSPSLESTVTMVTNVIIHPNISWKVAFLICSYKASVVKIIKHFYTCVHAHDWTQMCYIHTKVILYHIKSLTDTAEHIQQVIMYLIHLNKMHCFLQEGF